MAGENRSFRLEIGLGDATFSAEGEPSLVMQAFKAFRDEIHGSTPQPPDGKSKEPDKDEEEVGDHDRELNPDPHAQFAKGSPLPVFIKEKGPKTNAEAVAVMAVWANANQGTAEFTTDVMEELWRRSGRKKVSNLARDMGAAANNGWLDKAGRGKFTLPSYGIDFVRKLTAKKE